MTRISAICVLGSALAVLALSADSTSAGSTIKTPPPPALKPSIHISAGTSNNNKGSGKANPDQQNIRTQQNMSNAMKMRYDTEKGKLSNIK